MELAGEKRLSPRVRLQSPLRYRVIPSNADGFESAVIQDFSQTGFRFHSWVFVPKQASIILEMNHLGHAPVHSLAKAVWVREMPILGGYEVGGMFVEPVRSVWTTLNNLVPDS